MKVLLIGEFSALHRNLKEGLVKQGHDVTIAALGDSWKNISRDIDLDSSKSKYLAAIERRVNVFTKLYNLKGYDIVQFVNPFCLFYLPILSKILIKRLKKNNGKLFMLAAGTDSFYLKYGPDRMEYSPIEDYLKFDYKKTKHKYESRRYFNFNDWFADYVDGIIPIMYEYEVCYKDKENLLPCIPIPMNIDSIKYQANKVDDKIFIFHGLNRYGFKGTKYVEQAFEILKEKHGEKVELLIEGKMPLETYLSVMKRAHIIIDQTSSFSNGVNAIYALAMGKVVLGGGEEKSLASLDMTSTPVFNIKPNSDSIVKQIDYLISNHDQFDMLSRNSREHVERYHDYDDVAKLYVESWQKCKSLND